MRKIFFVLFISSAVLVYAPVFCAEELTVEKLSDAGVKHFYSQEFDKAIECYEKALAKALDDKEKARLFFNLSSAYLEKGISVYWEKKDDSFYKKSLEYSRKCLDIIPNY